MSRVSLWLFLVLIVVLYAMRAIAGEKPLGWTSSGFQFTLSDKDLVTSRAGKRVFSVGQDLDLSCGMLEVQARSHADELLRMAPEQRAVTPGIDEVLKLSHSFEILSVVGQVVSYLERSDNQTQPGGGSARVKRIVSRDASEADWRAPSILEYFSEKEIVDALKKDSYIAKMLGPSASPDGLNTLQGLAAAFAQAQSKRTRQPGEDPCAIEARMSDADTFLYSFAVHHLEKDHVAVRIGLEGEGQACVDQMKQLGILLPIPQKLRSRLENAARGKEGFLMADRAKVGSPKFTRECTYSVKDLVKAAEAQGR